MDKVRYNLHCSECYNTNSWGVLDSSRLRWCPFCQRNTKHYPNDSYVICEEELKDKINSMIDEEEKKNENKENKPNKL